MSCVKGSTKVSASQMERSEAWITLWNCHELVWGTQALSSMSISHWTWASRGRECALGWGSSLHKVPLEGGSLLRGLCMKHSPQMEEWDLRCRKGKQPTITACAEVHFLYHSDSYICMKFRNNSFRFLSTFNPEKIVRGPTTVVVSEA